MMEKHSIQKQLLITRFIKSRWRQMNKEEEKNS